MAIGILNSVLASDHGSVVSMNLFVALLCGCIVIGHLLEESRWMNESITALAIGVCTGVVILLTTGGKSSHLLIPSEEEAIFPQLYDNHAVWCSWYLISFGIISVGAIEIFKKMNIEDLQIGDFLAIGAIFSATDSVARCKYVCSKSRLQLQSLNRNCANRFILCLFVQILNQDETPLLYSLVFGEGVVNDATSVVLFNAIRALTFLTSTPPLLCNLLEIFCICSSQVLCSGVLTGLLSAFIIKKLYLEVKYTGKFFMHSTDREVALMILMAYLSYMLAELFYLSGILTVFFCGIVMSHYTWHNVTESSEHAFATLSFVAEIFIFLYVGMDALDIEKWRVISDSPGKSVGVSSILLGLILVEEQPSFSPCPSYPT
ncbi:hypothetical protein GQ457_13G027000 [Hibiscus cannabinus]